MKHSLRSKLTGRFIPVPKNPKIVSGRLYGYRGTIVRAGHLCANGKRHVSFHKQLHGFVQDNELNWIPKQQVDKYLQAVA